MFLFSLFLFPFLMLEKKKMQGNNVWNKRAEMGGQKQDPKVREHSKSLKETYLPFLHFCFSLWFFFFVFFSSTWEEKNGRRKRNRRVEAIAKSERIEWELKGKLLPFFWFFFLVFFFLSFVFFVLEKKKTITMCCRLFLYYYWNKKNNDNKLSSPSSLCLRRRRKKRRRGNTPSSGGLLMKKAIVISCHRWVLGVYRVQSIIKEKFVANVI